MRVNYNSFYYEGSTKYLSVNIPPHIQHLFEGKQLRLDSSNGNEQKILLFKMRKDKTVNAEDMYTDVFSSEADLENALIKPFGDPDQFLLLDHDWIDQTK